MRHPLDTGHNPPTKLGSLEDAVKIQEREGSRILRPMPDVVGIYGYLMKSLNGQPYYLVCKNGPLWTPKDDPDLRDKPVISVQFQLMTIANTQGYPIVLAWWGDPAVSKWPAPRLTMYHPDMILTRYWDKKNRRGAVQMINFPYYDGKHVLGVEFLADCWTKEKERWKKIREAEAERSKRQSQMEKFLGNQPSVPASTNSRTISRM